MMDQDSVESTAISRSSLFLKEDGEQMCFYMYPCPERRKIRPVIEKGHGILVYKKEADCIVLVPEGRQISFDPNAIQSKFVWDSVKANRLANIDDYRIYNQQQEEEPDRDDDIYDFGNSPAASDVVEEVQEATKRKEYTFDDDEKILNYVIKHKCYPYIKGVEVWRNLEGRQLLPGRTWQSLKERFRKQIVPKLDQFNVPEDAKKRILAHAPHASVKQYNKLKKSKRKLPGRLFPHTPKPKAAVAPITESPTSTSTPKQPQNASHASDKEALECESKAEERESRTVQEANQRTEEHFAETELPVVTHEDSRERTEKDLIAVSGPRENIEDHAETQMDTSCNEIPELMESDAQDVVEDAEIIPATRTREIGILTDPMVTGCGPGTCYERNAKSKACNIR